MLTRTKLAIAAALVASSASGALAQSQIGNGLSAEFVQLAATPSYTAPQRNAVLMRHVGARARTHHGTHVASSQAKSGTYR
jgi:hypothetical protein